MPYCAIMTCKSESRTKNLTYGGVFYHRFPKDPSTKEKWIDATGRQNWMPSKSSTICSLHFDEESLQISKKGNRYLHENAIPIYKILIFQDQNGSEIRCEPRTSQKRAQETPPLPIQEHLIIYEDENDTEIKSEPGTSPKRLQETPPRPIFISVSPPTDSPSFVRLTDSPSVIRLTDSPTNSTERKKTLGMLRWSQSKIRKQSLKIKVLQSRNRRLKSIIKNMEERITSFQNKYENTRKGNGEMLFEFNLSV